ncbi:MAG: HAD-IIIC family phosphatase [Magnetococcales bacterium]|nr:HAD-IIIC family phosphatase [Magnetococcales bacterium]
MGSRAARLLLISDFNMEIMAGCLRSHPGGMVGSVQTAPFGQVMPVLSGSVDDGGCHVALVWTRPESISDGYRRAKAFERVDVATVLAEVDLFAALLARHAEGVELLFVPTWVLPRSFVGHGLLEMQEGLGLTNLLMRMNLRLAERLAAVSNLYLLDAGRWFAATDALCFDPKMWYLAKVPFGSHVFKAAAHAVIAALIGLYGGSRKLIVLDLDNTLWGGIVGDDGWERLRLGGHDPEGEAFVDFQHALKNLTRKGVLLAIVSKNTEKIALEAIAKHPEMVLKLDDFAGWRINWDDKAANLLALTAELNLGLQSVVFIDDNPVERARVRDALPEILVPEWPTSKMAYRTTLESLDCFAIPALSTEDVERTQMYVAERQRQQMRQTVDSLDDWLNRLEITVTVERFSASNRQRTAQLFNKTNQMNLTTRRLAEPQLAAWSEGEGRMLHIFRVADRFGSAGLTGIVSLECAGEVATVVDFILSCRVMGKKIEECMTRHVWEMARASGAKRIVVRHLETPKNGPCLAFWQRSGFEQAAEDPHRFEWPVDRVYPAPAHIQLLDGTSASTFQENNRGES